MAEVCKNSRQTEAVTALELDAKVDKAKINVEVKDNGMTKVEQYHCIYCVHCQNNLSPALLQQKLQFISEKHNITRLKNKWNGLNLLPIQLDLIGCILPKKRSIKADPNGRRFLERPTEHVKSTRRYIDADFIKSIQKTTP